MTRSALAQTLRQGALALGLKLIDEQVNQLLDYADLIQKWNKVYNLTSVWAPDEILTHHLLDSLAVVQPLRRQTQDKHVRLLDVGTGAGLPAVAIAVCCPEIDVIGVDAVAKKAAFLQQVAAALRLENLQSIHGRVENLSIPYDVVASRAFASLADFVNVSSNSLLDGGVWMAMKGKQPDAEVAQLPAWATVFHVEQLMVPGLQAERCIVWLKKTSVLP